MGLASLVEEHMAVLGAAMGGAPKATFERIRAHESAFKGTTVF